MPNWVPVVSRVTQSSLPTTTGRIETSYAVQFVVGPHGPFTIQVPQSAATADEIKKRLDDFAAMINALPQEAPPPAPGS